MKFTDENTDAICKALNEVDWTDYGYSGDVEVNMIELQGNDAFMHLLEQEKFEVHRDYPYRIESGNYDIPTLSSNGDFSAVLDAAGVTDSR